MALVSLKNSKEKWLAYLFEVGGLSLNKSLKHSFFRLLAFYR
ncbi:hypothetical protein HPHPP2B_0226 [Helicobacter pylori Hp P-2b]|uniref:Uncharacterized protein n=1 Tax=Helicobacter pylori Hp P-2 TaxID=992073 RepID=J0PLK9_HELPX|nr:hypothetical protein HPHPP2_0224 [Helicobacter pylori Hp P-2]EJC57447.1 hypothetical protein HPHPP2B_0226 [Helicobacter pylori Hp P-2b]